MADTTTDGDWNVRVGNSAEWEPFGERNPEFLHRLGHLTATLNMALHRKLTEAGKLESLLFFTSRQAVDDFFEILLMCGNAEGSGAEKLLRSFFERVVLIRYLHQHPEKVDDYYDYYHVSMKKVLDSAIRFRGPEAFDKAKIAETETNYQRVKGKFKGRKCKECGYTENGHRVVARRIAGHGSSSWARTFHLLRIHDAPAECTSDA